MNNFKVGQTVFIWRECKFGKITSIRHKGSVEHLWIKLDKTEAPYSRIKGDTVFKMPRSIEGVRQFTAITKVSSIVNYIGIIATILIIAYFGGV